MQIISLRKITENKSLNPKLIRTWLKHFLIKLKLKPKMAGNNFFIKKILPICTRYPVGDNKLNCIALSTSQQSSSEQRESIF